MAEMREQCRYKMMARVSKLSLNKNLNFDTKIAWKRNVNKAETKTVAHQDCQSIFNDELELELNLVYNHASKIFQPKMTEFAVLVIYQGKMKSGGHVKYDVADIVNNDYKNYKTQLNLLQCPDPEAYIEVFFNYEVVHERSSSLHNTLRRNGLQQSMFDTLGMEHDLSQIDFKDIQHGRASEKSTQKESLTSTVRHEDLLWKEWQSQKIDNILNKFQSAPRKLTATHTSFLLDSTKNESLQISAIPTEQEERLRMRVRHLQRELELKCNLIDDYEKKIQTGNRKIDELELKLQLADQKYRELMEEGQHRMDLRALPENSQNYKDLYQQCLLQLQQVKRYMCQVPYFSKENYQNRQFEEQEEEEEGKEIHGFPQQRIEKENSNSQLLDKIDQLQRQNIQLQTKIASSSHKIAQLFNAAYEYGGSKLLDHLQNSIGLIEQEQF